MSNPYAPPSTRNDAPETLSNKDSILRRIGALSLAYLSIMALWNPFPDLLSALMGVALLVVLIFGFLRGRRKFHVWIALFMALSIAVQTYFMNLAIAHPERLPVPLGPRPWLEFAIAIIPHVIALTCASALYFRARATRA
jgi:hypothetical protein